MQHGARYENTREYASSKWALIYTLGKLSRGFCIQTNALYEKRQTLDRISLNGSVIHGRWHLTHHLTFT